MEVTSAQLHQSLQNYFGFDKFKAPQEEIIKSILAKKDTFVIMPTGGGKSLCYQLPALMNDGCALVVSPLIALMKNQVDLLRSYCGRDSVAHFLNSTLSKTQVRTVREDLESGETKLLYIAPETLTKQENLDYFKALPISFLAVDEAHCISEWGHDFRPEYRRLREMINIINKEIPIIALTATATPKVQSDIVKNLELRNPNIFVSSFNRANLYYEMRPKQSKDQAIREIVKILQKKPQSGIIYTLNRKTTEEIAGMLDANGISAAAYHAGLDAKTRSKRQDQFLNEDIDVIVATIAFGMGIDKPDVRFVFHFNIPKSLENYYQETGRAGRDGRQAHCLCFYSHKDIQKLEHLMRDKTLSEREMGAQLIDETVAYAESAVCRRRMLLHYFGEDYPDENCGNCDNCRHPKEQIEVRRRAMKVIQTIEEVDGRFPINYIVDILSGNKTPQISTFRHDNLKSFGIGKEENPHFWNSIIRQMMLEKLIEKDIEEYGLLKVTKKGKKFLKEPYPFKMVLNHQFNDNAEVEDITGGTAAADPTLFNLLKKLRKDVAKKKALPPYIIFQESSLEDMATNYPTTMEELEKIQGVSKGKAMKFGRKFIKLIAQYVEENEVDKPNDFIIKSVVNKSGQKVFIIRNIDKRIPLETIADNKGIEVSELLDQMETIVSSGTKLNLDYCINEELDEYAQEDIIDYFKESDSPSIELAEKEFEDDEYTPEQLQLMRIKFISQYGN